MKQSCENCGRPKDQPDHELAPCGLPCTEFDLWTKIDDYAGWSREQLIEEIGSWQRRAARLAARIPTETTYMGRPAKRLEDGTILFYARKDLQPPVEILKAAVGHSARNAQPDPCLGCKQNGDGCYYDLALGCVGVKDF